jgi:hypothetical protein
VVTAADHDPAESVRERPGRQVVVEVGEQREVGAASGSVDSADQPGSDAASYVAPALHRAAIAHGIACAPGAPPLVRAVGLLEAAAELASSAGCSTSAA